MQERDGGFQITIFKNLLTEEQLRKVGLNDRQIRAITFIKTNSSITNAQYQKLINIGKTTATSDLQQLVDQSILKQAGTKGRGSKYKLAD